jgi:hypothetical protein
MPTVKRHSIEGPAKKGVHFLKKRAKKSAFQHKVDKLNDILATTVFKKKQIPSS